MNNNRKKCTSSIMIGQVSLFLMLLLLLQTNSLFAQAQNTSNLPKETLVFDAESDNLPSPRGAFFRSMVLPGWGHHYVDKTSWNRGKVHLGADILMMVGYLGLLKNINTLENNLITHANARAGINLKNQSRQLELAVSKFNSIDEYNDYQLRSRNWDKVIPKTSQTSWQWQNTDERHKFQDTRDKIAKSDNQLPALLTLFVVNRVLSGINAFTRARDMKVTPEASLSYINEFGSPGLTAKLVVGF